MLKDKLALEQYLDTICDKIVVDTNKCKSVYSYANETYDIPKGIVADLVSKRMSISEASEFILFILLDSMQNVLKENRIKKLDEFYTMQEVQYYRKSKYENSNIKFPITFKMIQINEDQWVGNIDVKTLMQLRKAQLVNYNINAQRTMQKVVKGDKSFYKITLNHKAVKSIVDNFKNNTFISNTITLNIPIDISNDFYYNKDDCSLVIKSLNNFHIIDGYHRYIAACQMSDMDPEFNYPMELRIVNWDDIKAQSFIWQEDQKTQLKKVDSESLNMNKAANIIVTRLNDNALCNMKGLISRNQGIINFGEFSMLVDWFYVKNNDKKGNANAIQLQAVRELTENLNILTESDMKYLEEPWDYKLMLSAMCVFDYFNKNELNKRNMCDVVNKVYEKLSISNDKKFLNHTPRKILMDIVNNAIIESI